MAKNGHWRNRFDRFGAWPVFRDEVEAEALVDALRDPLDAAPEPKSFGRNYFAGGLKKNSAHLVKREQLKLEVRDSSLAICIIWISLNLNWEILSNETDATISQFTKA